MNVLQLRIASILNLNTITNSVASFGFNLFAPSIGAKKFHFLLNFESWFSSELSFNMEGKVTRVLNTTWNITVHLAIAKKLTRVSKYTRAEFESTSVVIILCGTIYVGKVELFAIFGFKSSFIPNGDWVGV